MKNITTLFGNIWLGLALLMFLGIGETAQAQRLDYESQQSVVLSSGLNIVLYREMGSYGRRSNNFRFMPPAQSVRLGKKVDGKTPEFLFLKYTTEQRESEGGAQGGLLHFLVEWGLTPEQREELESKISDMTGGRGKLMGPVDLRPNEGESFKIVSATLQDRKLTPTFITSGKAPPMEGGKAAVAARLDKIGAQLFDATLQKTSSIVDVSLVLDYQYTVMVKAAKGYLKYDLDITSTQGDDMAYDFMRKELDNRPQELQNAMDLYNANKGKLEDQCEVASGMGNMLVAMQAMDAAIGNTSGGGTGSPYEYGASEQMMRKLYDYFEQKERIILKWEESLDDDRLDVMREAFFEFFLNSFAEPEIPEITSLADNADAPSTGMSDEYKDGVQNSFSMKSCTQMTSTRTVDKTIRLDNIILPVTRHYQMVANIANSYDQVRDNPACVGTVNLNDPFFQHRDINFIMDLEAEEIFNKEINYVTVNVRKRRSSGNDFSDALTIGRDYMRKNGTLAKITYSRGEDKKPDLYDYKVQWSLKGGNIFPDNPRWIKAQDWQGVTLAAPIKPRTIEFEADLEEMRELGVTRATLQVRYQKFGKEVEENIPLTVSKNEPLIEHTIYQDREMQGYVYRMVLNHKEHGKLALDWEAKINDDYVYAIIPDELRENKKEFIAKLVTAARSMMKPAADGSVNPKVAILDKFAGAIELFLKE